jgi:predicted small lipoprotein YifL
VSRALAAAAALALALVLAGCGVKGPPRPSGAPEKDPPHEIFRSSGGARP